MKFLCMACDQPMKLQSVDDSGGGSLSVRYGCPDCDAGFAMLTNPFETEMVQSLGVKIGPAAAGGDMAEGARAASGGKCPFSSMVAGMGDGADEAPAAAPAPNGGTRRPDRPDLDRRGALPPGGHPGARAADGAPGDRALRPVERL